MHFKSNPVKKKRSKKQEKQEKKCPTENPMLELRNCALHATRLYPLLWLDKCRLSTSILQMQFPLSTVALVGLRNLSNKTTYETALFVQNRSLVLGRWDVNGRVFGEEIGRFEVNLMRLNWHDWEVCAKLAE